MSSDRKCTKCIFSEIRKPETEIQAFTNNARYRPGRKLEGHYLSEDIRDEAGKVYS